LNKDEEEYPLEEIAEDENENNHNINEQN